MDGRSDSLALIERTSLRILSRTEGCGEGE